MDLLKAMKISGTALSAQRTKLNVIAENLANSETTRTRDGGPYRRKMVVLAENPVEGFKDVMQRQEDKPMGVVVAQVVDSQEDFRLVYNPSHPDANPDTGYVSMPNVNLLTEMADMMLAKRAYDASVTAMKNTKAMISKALEIGK
ncbi:MAG: flagellar basal body rod protein FlgC [Deltaproteobacteria bacterium]|nr:flagellar basal body rod protein FlgC [Deltaproteobacteria bacterium]